MQRDFLGKFSRLDANSLLSGGLLALLLLAFVGVVYILSTIVATNLGFIPAVQNVWEFSPPWWLNLTVFAFIAITILPVTRWLRGQVNDLVFAQHGDPYLLIAKVNQQLQTMTLPQFTLPQLAATIANELKLPYVVIETTNNALSRQFSVGKPVSGAELERVPITYLDRPMGFIEISARASKQSLSEIDLTLLEDVARELGIALRAAQLAADLQAARELLVISREEERRRIRNDLHDGLAPTLSSLQLQLGALRGLVGQHPDQAEAMINEMREDLRTSTAEVRRLVYDLRPPLLDELGLVGALRSSIFQGAEISLEVRAPQPLPKLPAAVEVAVYRIASEALHNVLKHAQAATCQVLIEVEDGCLILKVIDNGIGLQGEICAGVGLRSMKERAAELGGILLIQPNEPTGTIVLARIPIENGCKVD